MTDFDVVVRGGRVVTEADERECDIGIRGGKIAALGERLGDAAEVIDASGRLVLPGGIDAHCHLSQRSSFGVLTADDFTSGSISAACGGTTTIIPFAPQQKGEALGEAVAAYAAKAEGKSVLDYGFNLIISDPTPAALDVDLPALIAQGHTAVKVFMTYDSVRVNDRQLLDVLARDLGAITMVHAENHELMVWLAERLVKRGDVAPRFHAEAHAPQAEREAVHRVIELAEAVGAPVYIVHLSDGAAIDVVRRARARGAVVLGETCTQYLVLSSADMDKPGFEGAKFVYSPPARVASNQPSVWRGLVDDTIQTLHSDHAGYRFDDVAGKKVNGTDAPFNRIPNGIPGIEARLPILFSEGVGKGRITLRRFVEVTASNPARIFGLYPRKGVIALGADADLALWDPERRVTLSIDNLHDRMDYTPYEGMEITGWPVTTLSRGRVVQHEGEVRGQPGMGELLRRTAPRLSDFFPNPPPRYT